MKANNFFVSIALTLVAFFSSSCGEEEKNQVCTPGVTQVCHCVGGEKGVQVCGSMGLSWEKCVCSNIGKDGGLNDGCIPKCEGKTCGPNECGGKCSPGCSSGYLCDEKKGKCTLAPCKPNCVGRNCGSDGCGGTCGKCTGNKICISKSLN